MTRSEHMAWCKERALEYVTLGELDNAVASMMSDLGKHEETKLGEIGDTLMLAGMQEARTGDRNRLRKWIEGFN